ncbi:MAG: radical SAM protein [candidate division WOR-3 bacterium]
MGLKGIKLTGGEPFLMKHILELLYWLRNEELSIIIETNGSLITKEVAKVIKETEVSQVSVSLDSTDPQVHDYIRGITGAFEQTIRGINYLHEYGVRTQIITSLISKNSEELPDIVDFASKLGADSLKINPVIPMGRGENMQKRGELLDVEKVLEVYKKLKELFNNNFPLKIYFDIPPAFKSLNDLTDDFGTCKIHNILGILSNGMVSICGIGKNITQLVMGNIGKDSIIDI